jgi:hypothetical protein
MPVGVAAWKPGASHVPANVYTSCLDSACRAVSELALLSSGSCLHPRGASQSCPYKKKGRQARGAARPVADCLTRNLLRTARVCPFAISHSEHSLATIDGDARHAGSLDCNTTPWPTWAAPFLVAASLVRQGGRPITVLRICASLRRVARLLLPRYMHRTYVSVYREPGSHGLRGVSLAVAPAAMPSMKSLNWAEPTAVGLPADRSCARPPCPAQPDS